MRRSGLRRIPWWLVAAAVAITLIWALLVSKTDAGGLTARVLPAGQEVGAPLYVGRDRHPSSASVAAFEQRAGGQAVSVRWDGVLYVPPGLTRIGAVAAGRLRLRIDNQLMLDWAPRDTPHDWSEPVELPPGPHQLTVEYERKLDDPRFELRWDGDSPFRLVEIPASAYATERQSSWSRAVVWWTPRVAVALGVLWAGLLLAALWHLLRRTIPFAVEADGRTRVVLVVASLLFATGIWWGWPGGFWAPDELDAWAVYGAIDQRFANGWHDRYPPLHFYLLSLVDSPLLLYSRLGWLDAATTWNAVFMMGRLVSLGMAVATLAIVAGMTSRVLGAGVGWIAALLAAVFLPMPFYAKTANLDVPYLFWFAIAFACLLDIHRGGGVRAVVGYAVAGAAAIATKDQAYGLCVLPSAHLAWTLARRPGGWRLLTLGAAAGVLTLVLAFNLPFNWAGFRAHVELIVGPASEDYRIFPATAAGQAALFQATVREFAGALGVAGMALLALGLATWHTERRRDASERDFLVAAGLVSASYYLTFLAPIGYVYDRFLLPLAILAALPAARGVVWLTTRRTVLARWARGSAVLLVAWLVWRAVSLDALLLQDSRYRAEAWLRGQMSLDYMVGTVNQFGYLPRLAEFRHVEFPATREDTLAASPTFIVVNTEFPQRFDADSRQRQWLLWLESGDAPYVEVFRDKRRPWWSALIWQPRFRDAVEDQFTNLDKANPEIVIYRRR